MFHVAVYRKILNPRLLLRLAEDYPEGLTGASTKQSGSCHQLVRRMPLRDLPQLAQKVIVSTLLDSLHAIVPGSAPGPICGNLQITRYLPNEGKYNWHRDIQKTSSFGENTRAVTLVMLLKGGDSLEIMDQPTLNLEPGDAACFSGYSRHRVVPSPEERVSLSTWIGDGTVGARSLLERTVPT